MERKSLGCFGWLLAYIVSVIFTIACMFIFGLYEIDEFGKPDPVNYMIPLAILHIGSFMGILIYDERQIKKGKPFVSEKVFNIGCVIIIILIVIGFIAGLIYMFS